eukprot:jgi/Undpi1/3178/HiC_scaffold_15.g06552.m1
MGFFGVKLKSGEKEAVEVPPGWCLQLCTAALAPAKKGSKSRDAEATLWVQVEGEIGDSRFLLGTLQAGGPYAQISVAHCLTSVDGEVIFEAEGTGVIHLTGFFNREYEPDLENDDMTENSSEESSEEKAGDSSEEESEESSEENADDGSVDSGEAEIEALRAILKDRAKRQGRGGGANGEDADKSELTKQERKRQRKRENKKIFGGGKIAVPGKNVKICYEGCFPDGRVFDKNQNRRRPLQFRIGMRSVIAGMDRGVEGMRVGGSREIAIPAALALGVPRGDDRRAREVARPGRSYGWRVHRTRGGGGGGGGGGGEETSAVSFVVNNYDNTNKPENKQQTKAAEAAAAAAAALINTESPVRVPCESLENPVLAP